jgi:hypothetical protein
VRLCESDEIHRHPDDRVMVVLGVCGYGVVSQSGIGIIGSDFEVTDCVIAACARRSHEQTGKGRKWWARSTWL